MKDKKVHKILEKLYKRFTTVENALSDVITTIADEIHDIETALESEKESE